MYKMSQIDIKFRKNNFTQIGFPKCILCMFIRIAVDLLCGLTEINEAYGVFLNSRANASFTLL